MPRRLAATTLLAILLSTSGCASLVSQAFTWKERTPVAGYVNGVGPDRIRVVVARPDDAEREDTVMVHRPVVARDTLFGVTPGTSMRMAFPMERVRSIATWTVHPGRAAIVAAWAVVLYWLYTGPLG